jgi:hypothetical protein
MDIADALRPLQKFIGKPCALKIPMNIPLWGRSPDDWPAILFDWSKVKAGERKEFIADTLADAFPDAALMTPFAVVGPSGLHDAGTTFELRGQADGILFLDLKNAADGGCPVLFWNTDEPARKLRKVANEPGSLPFQIITPKAPKTEDPDRLPFFVVQEGPSAKFALIQDDHSLGLVALEGTLKKGQIDYSTAKVVSQSKHPNAAEHQAAAIGWRAKKLAEGYTHKPYPAPR